MAQIVARIMRNDKQLGRGLAKTGVLFFCLALGCLSFAACNQTGVQTFSFSAKDYAFVPNTWTVRAGERVTLRMFNESNNEHEWVLLKQGENVTMPFDDDDEARIAFESEVEPGQVKVSFFTAPTTPGTYRIVCGIAGHLENGMEGTLVVQ